MIAEKHYDSANDCYDHAPDVETGYALHAERTEQNSPNDRTHDAQGNVEPEACTTFVDNLAANKPCNKTQYQPAEIPMGYAPTRVALVS